MDLRSILCGTQPPDNAPVSTNVVLIVFVLIVVAIAAYRDPKIATAIGAACAVGALLIVLLVT